MGISYFLGAKRELVTERGWGGLEREEGVEGRRYLTEYVVLGNTCQ